MDKRNKTALAYLLVGVAAAGRALLAVPENAAIQLRAAYMRPLPYFNLIFIIPLLYPPCKRWRGGV